MLESLLMGILDNLILNNIFGNYSDYENKKN